MCDDLSSKARREGGDRLTLVRSKINGLRACTCSALNWRPSVSILHELHRGLQIFSVLTFFSLSACSLDAPQLAAVDTDLSKVGYSLSLRRASLTSRDFESYKLLPNGVFVECGTIYQGQPETRFRSIEQPNPEAINHSRQLARDIVDQYSQGGAQQADAAGRGEGLADPGVLTLLASNASSKIELRTSVDWVEQKRNSFAALVNQFIKAVRGLPEKAPCSNEEFYGIGR